MQQVALVSGTARVAKRLTNIFMFVQRRQPGGDLIDKLSKWGQSFVDGKRCRCQVPTYHYQ